MIFFVQLLAFYIVHGTFALGTLYKSTASCYGVISPASNFMFSTCPPGEVIAIKDITVAYKAAALNCTFDNVQDQFQLCCSNITEQDCQMSYNFHPNNAVQYIEKCNGRSSCNVMATVVLLQDCSGVPDHYPNYMHINYYCIPETSILSIMSGTITSSSLGQSVYLQSPGFNNGQKIPSKETLSCSVHTCDMDSTLSIAIYQIVMENKWAQCEQRLLVKRSDGSIIYEWQCKDNNAMPEILQTLEQNLTIHLENTLPKDLGSFWLGFAGSSPDSRVTVSCTSETKQCPDLSTTTLQSTIVDTKTLESTTVETTTLESTTVETPGSPKGLQKEDIVIAVGGVAGFGLIAFMLSIVFIRRRINKRKAHQNADPETTAQTAYRMHLPTIDETFGRMNPIYDSVCSNSTYGFLGRIAGDRGSHTRPKNPFRHSNS
ncbi:uncharacterized protein LOC128216427 isoform X2 [Mya arenaria]|uniref:uncharacterized protein LOC128216427 isoform X2 n=1 Tax=Mya arenaria TaxID=6604 RepID=UPI0022E67141|nr:uncharacterized protein LOC128216427 isoform X2 [Mya arenaria]